MTEDEEWEAVRAALRDVGVDPTDLARFVNAPDVDGYARHNLKRVERARR